ncbi:hypothetical protein L195_g053750, partial [Trifolium pratense]
DEVPLSERFGRLFDLAETKLHTVAEMFSLGWGTDGVALVWRRQLRAWEEEMLGEWRLSSLDMVTLDDAEQRIWHPQVPLKLIWLASVWVVWTERNHRLFTGSVSTLHQMMDKIKLFSYRWLKTTSVSLVPDYHSWWSCPLLCLCLL